MTFVCALIVSLVALSVCLGFQRYRKSWRAKRLKGLELTPNCLLTRYPIAFIAGRRSLFRLFDHWNDIPLYLREHGYDVLVIEPPNRGDRVTSILTALASLKTKVHVITDATLEADLKALAEAKFAGVASLTVVKSRARAVAQTRSTPLTSADLKPLDVAIGAFELNPTPVTPSWLNFGSRAMLTAHNLLFADQIPVDAVETAEMIDRKGWTLESRFLELAISLAERDAQWSHESYEGGV